MGRSIEEQEEKPATLVTGDVRKPSGLSDAAAQEWDRIIGELQASGIKLSPAHRITLSVCATLAADIRDCWAVLQANGGNYTTAGTGTVKLHPAAARLDTLRRDLTKALTLLGLTRPTAETPDDGEGELERVLRGEE